MSDSKDEDPREQEWSWHERVLILWDRAAVRWLVVLLAAGVMVSVVLMTRSSPQELATAQVSASGEPVSLRADGPGDPSAKAPSLTAEATVVVDVAGLVRKPGIIELPSGSRVADAIAAAGGIKPGGVNQGSAGVNLARVLVDGEQVVVGIPAQPGLANPGISTPSSSAGGATKIRLNSATASELEELPRVGPVTAAKIIEYRNQNGGFRSVEQLRDVSGIGDVTFSGIAPLVEL